MLSHWHYYYFMTTVLDTFLQRRSGELCIYVKLFKHRALALIRLYVTEKCYFSGNWREFNLQFTQNSREAVSVDWNFLGVILRWQTSLWQGWAGCPVNKGMTILRGFEYNCENIISDIITTYPLINWLTKFSIN